MATRRSSKSESGLVSANSALTLKLAEVSIIRKNERK